MYKRKLFTVIVVVSLLMMASCEEDPLATLTTTAVSEITSVSAVSGGNMTVAEGAALTAQGMLGHRSEACHGH